MKVIETIQSTMTDEPSRPVPHIILKDGNEMDAIGAVVSALRMARETKYTKTLSITIEL